jgi:hypothetical protein
MVATLTSRNPNVWHIRCGNHAEFTGPTYTHVENQWRQHLNTPTNHTQETKP